MTMTVRIKTPNQSYADFKQTGVSSISVNEEEQELRMTCKYGLGTSAPVGSDDVVTITLDRTDGGHNPTPPGQ